MGKRVVVGIVTSDKMQKTRRVEIPRVVRNPKYGKFVRTRTICYVDDPAEESHVGDKVEIIEAPRMSKRKRWKLVQVVAKSQAVDLAALREQQAEQQQQG